MSPARVLICDDVEDIRMLMRIAFESDAGFEVVGEASDGQEGIERAEELKPDAILLDINMPVKGGLEALPDLRRVVPDAAIVIFTGFEEWSLGAHAQERGADAYIEKGTEIGEILDQVRSVIQNRLVKRSSDGA